MAPVYDYCSECGIKGLLRGERPDGFVGPDLEADEDTGTSRCSGHEPSPAPSPASAIVRSVRVYWDDRPGLGAGVRPGWYWDCRDFRGDTVTDSVKICGPVDPDDFDHDERAELGAALRKAYPFAEVTFDTTRSSR